jgi:hypothetical protein
MECNTIIYFGRVCSQVDYVHRFGIPRGCLLAHLGDCTAGEVRETTRFADERCDRLVSMF